MLCVTVKSRFADRTRFRGWSATHKTALRGHRGDRHSVGFKVKAKMNMSLVVGDTGNTGGGQGDVQMRVCVREFSTMDAQ